MSEIQTLDGRTISISPAQGGVIMTVRASDGHKQNLFLPQHVAEDLLDQLLELGHEGART